MDGVLEFGVIGTSGVGVSDRLIYLCRYVD